MYLVILDCCHSGGMDRDVGKTARSVAGDSRSIPVGLDRHLWQGEGKAVPYRRKSLSSCVLLAACSPDETAREFEKPDGTYGGRFTSALIPLLQQAPLEDTTAMELISQRELKELPGQSPRCKRPSRKDSPNSLQKFRVEMGSLIGVLPGTEFKAYDRNKELCTFAAQSVLDDHSILVGKDVDPVDIPVGRVATTGRPLQFAQSTLDEADIAVRSEGDQIVIAFLRSQRENRIALLKNPAHLPAVVEGIARFNYFLDCANKKDRIDGLGVEMYRLQGEYPACKPDPPNENLIRNGQVRLASEKGGKYGFTIRNTSPEDLFPSLFYLDPETYTIKQWYSPACGRAPLLSEGGAVTLGMGSDRAFEFVLSPGELSSSGFLKLFVTNEYIDLGWIGQKSPFEERFDGRGRLRLSHDLWDLDSTWDAVTVALTVTAAADEEENV
ncbi:hypothetical protein B0H12DRAFT_1243902 [Mycena haematopus]|nr:hypothetical protein B0H12DRAFT_1243902 [Mycena haematopus]